MGFSAAAIQPATDALLLIKTANAKPYNWLNGTNPCGPMWSQLACDANGTITSLYLRGAGLAGTLPAGLSALTGLTQLELGQNQFHGEGGREGGGGG